MNTIKLIGNDVIGTGIVNVYWSDNAGSVAPIGFDFVRVDGKNEHKQSFNLSRASAKQLAAFILEHL